MQTIAKVGRGLDLSSVEWPEWGVSEAVQALKYLRKARDLLGWNV